MDYRDIALFTRVVTSGSFTAAAEALGLPKSSVSRSVARLEKDLGVRLLQRTTRRFRLTEAGTEFFEKAKGAIAGLEEAAAAVREFGAEPRGRVRLTAPADSFNVGLPEAIAAFVKKYPGIQVDLLLASRVVDLVAEGVDLAVRAGNLADSSLIVRRIGTMDSALFAAPAYLRRNGRPKSLRDLGDHDCILFRARADRATWHLTGPSGDEAVEVKGPVAADEMAFLARLSAAGAGIGLLPLGVVRHFVQRGELEPVLPEYRSKGAAVQVVLPSSAFVPSRVALLRDFLVEALSSELEAVNRECSKRAPR